MAKKIVAIEGTYRRGRVIETAVDVLLATARQQGAETEKIILLDRHVEFCTNCRCCTQTPGSVRGLCPLKDDVDAILTQIEAADGFVLASPVNFGGVTAIMKRFIERLICYAYWPWDSKKPPQMRIKRAHKPAVVITSSACPAFIAKRVMTNPVKTMKTAAKCFGAKTLGTLYYGMAGLSEEKTLSESERRRAEHLGIRLTEAV